MYVYIYYSVLGCNIIYILFIYIREVRPARFGDDRKAMLVRTVNLLVPQHLKNAGI
jgi:hypothetical protein